MINFAERLKAARKMKGWSLDELSTRAGENVVSKQSLGKYENSEMQPGEEILFALCKALDIKTDYFFRRLSFRIGEVNFRKLDIYSASMQEKVKAKTQDFVERYLELEEIIGEKSKFDTKKYTGIKVNSFDEVEDVAQYIRKSWKLGNDPLNNVVELLEDNHVKVVEIEEEEAFMGMSTIIKKNIPVVVLNNSKRISNTRKRFTALHELGHLTMSLEHLSHKEQESYCNRFAGAMLISRAKMLQEMGSEKRTKIFLGELGQLKKQYGISISALLFRLAECDITTQSNAFGIMSEMRRLGIFEKEPEEFDFKGEEKSNRFVQLLLRGVAMDLISTSKAAALNNQKVAEFRKFLD